MKSENVTRKLDTLGRITLPKGLRTRLGIPEGAEMEIFTHEYEGITYICLADVNAKDNSVQTLLSEMDKLNLSVEDVITLLNNP